MPSTPEATENEPMIARRFTLFSSLSLLVGSALLSACSSKPDAAEQVGSAHQNWQIIGGDAHGLQGLQALSFLNAGALAGVAVAETLPDLPPTEDGERSKVIKNGKVIYNGTKDHSFFHFDNCRFQEATELINKHYDEIIRILSSSDDSLGNTASDWDAVLKQFGFILHASQDFYAHSNWVESGGTTLIDAGLGKWEVLTPNKVLPNGLVVVENTLAQGVTPHLESATHRLKLTSKDDQGVTHEQLGLMTGRYDNKDEGTGVLTDAFMWHGDAFNCRPQDMQVACAAKDRDCDVPSERRAVCAEIWKSTYLAKDHPTTTPPGSSEADIKQRDSWRNAAHDLALQQTEHEFCRLAKLMDDNPATGGSRRLYKAWVDDTAAATALCEGSRFSDRTSAWKLPGVEGSRLSVADIDGDDYPDLVVRSAGDEESDLSAGGTRHVWLLHNDHGTGFSDITASSGLLSGRIGATQRNRRASQVVAFADIDNDGILDAFSGSPPYSLAGFSGSERSEVLLGQATQTFKLYAKYPFSNLFVYPGGATFLDYDRDGFIDLFVPARDPMQVGPTARGAGWLFHHETDPQKALFTETTASLGAIAGGYLQSSLACDLNGDGRQELLATAMDRGPSRLWQAKSDDATFDERGGDSHFAADDVATYNDDLAAQAYCSYLRQDKVWDAFWPSAARCQNRPGGCPAACGNKFPCDVFKARTTESLADCKDVKPFPADHAKEQAGLAARWVHLRDSPVARLGGRSFTTICADFDGDGRMDLFQASERSSAAGAGEDVAQILRNTTTGNDVALTRVDPALSGLALHHQTGDDWIEGIQSAAAFDFDNDGWTDLFIDGADAKGNRGQLFRNGSSVSNGVTSLQFRPVTVPNLQRSQGIVVADFDRDGDLDFVAGHSCLHTAVTEDCNAEQVHFFENVSPPGASSHWLQLKLDGIGGATHANKAAIGARASIALGDHKLVQEVDGGHGAFGTQSDLVLHFGLGSASGFIPVDVRWPNRARTCERFLVQVDTLQHVIEGKGTPCLP